MLINGKSFEIFDIETNRSLAIRLAASMQTLPKYLITEPQLEISAKTVDVLDLLHVLRTSSEGIDELLVQYADAIFANPLDIEKDVVEIWASMNRDHLALGSRERHQVLFAMQSIVRSFPRFETISLKLQRSPDEIRRSLDEAIRANARKAVTIERDFRASMAAVAVDRLMPETEWSTIQVVATRTLRFATDTIAAETIFDAVRPNASWPVFVLGMERWEKTEAGDRAKGFGGRVKVSEKLAVTNLGDTDDLFRAPPVGTMRGYFHENAKYRTLDLRPTAAAAKTTEMEAEYSSSEGETNPLEFFAEICTLPFVVATGSNTSTKITGDYTVPNFTPRILFFCDMLLTHPQARMLLYPDHSVRFLMRSNVTLKTTIGSPSPISVRLFVDATTGLRVKISHATSLAHVEQIRKVLAKLFVLYQSIEPEIRDAYAQWNLASTDIDALDAAAAAATTEGASSDGSRLVPLKKQVPEMFLPNYTRKCLKQPMIVSEEDAKNYEHTLRFPLQGEPSPTRIYACPHPSSKYPGIRENPLANKTLFPVLPCCYTMPQNIPGKLWHKYLAQLDSSDGTVAKGNGGDDDEGILTDDDDEGPETEFEKPIAGEFYSSHKFVKRGKLGIVSDFFTNLLRFLLDDARVEVFRRGTGVSLRSMVASVGTALGTPTSLARILDHPACPLPTVCRQELPHLSASTIEELWHNRSELFDERFYRLLEIFFRVNILVVERIDEEYRFAIPPNHGGHYRARNAYPTIICYKHWGSESDEARFPQYETIVWYERDGPATTVLETAKIWEIFANYHIVVDKFVPIEDVRGQILDSYGKCRALRRGTTERIAPRPPLDLPEIPDVQYVPPKMGVFQEWRGWKQERLRLAYQLLANGGGRREQLQAANVAEDVAEFVLQQAGFDPDRLERGWLGQHQIDYAFLEDYEQISGTIFFASMDSFFRWLLYRDAATVYDAPIDSRDSYLFRVTLHAHERPQIFRATLVRPDALYALGDRPYSMLVPSKYGTEYRLYQIGANPTRPTPTHLLSPTFMLLRKTRIYELERYTPPPSALR